MAEPLPLALLERIADRFRVLGDATRLSILRLLLDEGELNVGEIVERLSAGQANVSKHLRILHDAGVVSRRARGTSVHYTVADPSLTQICDLVCGRIREQVANDAKSMAIV